jgi:hypothetical protein
MKALLFFLLVPSIGIGQGILDLSRYTSIWVADKNPDPKSWIPNETYSIEKESPFNNCDRTGLTVLIPDSNEVVVKGKPIFILGYLINNSSDTILIDRCDATIYPAETQVMVDCEWKTFQVSIGSTCGNSYFKSGLPPKSYYILHINRPTSGDIQTQFRLKLKLDGKEYVSNPCSVGLTGEEIQKARQSLEL